MSERVSYRSLLRDRANLRMLIAGLISRLPLAVVGMGTVLLVSRETGSFALAGFASAMVLLASAAAGPALGAVADRSGQRIVLVAGAIANLLAIGCLIAAASDRAAPAVVLVCAAFVGATVLPVASFMRARWTRLLNSDGLRAAFAIEAVLDEVVWIGGPALAAFLSVAINPAAGLAVGGLIGAIGSFWLAGIRRGALFTAAGGHEHPHTSYERPHVEHHLTAMLRLFSNRGVLAAFLCAVFVGSSFGFADLSAVALTKADGVPGMAGLIFTAFSLGSAVGGFVFGALPLRRSSLATLAFTTGLIGVLYVLPALAPNTWWMLGAGLIAGVAISPFSIAANRVVQEVAAPQIVTQALAWVGTTFLMGMAI
jgi:MFS family permease